MRRVADLEKLRDQRGQRVLHGLLDGRGNARGGLGTDEEEVLLVGRGERGKEREEAGEDGLQMRSHRGRGEQKQNREEGAGETPVREEHFRRIRRRIRGNRGNRGSCGNT